MGTSCLAPSTKKGRCKLHGGARGSGAPIGNRNALKHGRHTNQNIAGVKEMKKLIKSINDLISNKYSS
ncbi:MAG: hypothetical protein K0R66_870 [Gammaproteobacteria bacterium]|jgi:glucans biosynthesis protein|nr:hypothetical protein [Gammaproteobacteria bacterium]